MKVMMLNPYFDSGRCIVPSLGLGFLSYWLKKNGIECHVVEPSLQNRKRTDVLAELSTYDVLGLVVYTENRFQSFDFAKDAKVMYPNLRIVVGGPHVFSLSKMILEHYPFIDCAVIGDGEEALVSACRGTCEAPNLTYRKDGVVVQNEFKIYSDFNERRYDWDECYLPTWKDVEVQPYLMKLNHVPFIASRGCPYDCTFCATPKICKRMWRGYTPEVVVEQMEELNRKYNVKYFRFYDALFYPKLSNITEIATLIKERNLSIHYRIDTHVGLHESMYRTLRDSGCDILGYGIESGSDRILNLIRKGITGDQVRKSVRLAKKEGFYVIGYFMMFHPTETQEDVNKTNDLRRIFDSENMQFFKIHPDTCFYDELKSRGEINDEVWFDRHLGMDTPWGNEFYYTTEQFKSAPFSGKGVIFR